MPKGRDEVQAAMHPVVLDVLAVEATLITEILLKLLVYVVSDGLPAVGRGCMRWAVRVAPQPQGRLGWLEQGLCPSQAFLTIQSC